MTKQVIALKDLTKTYGKHSILKGISFEINQGEKIAIMGPSGVGKSTLLHIIGTLEQPSSGSVFLFGKNICKQDLYLLRNQKIGFVFQGFYLLEDYTVFENVLFPAKIARKPVPKKEVLKLLIDLGLSHCLNAPAKQLSGGEKQRVAIARALCNNPDLLLADEPTGNLDEENAEQIHNLLISFAEKLSKTLVIVTHNQKLASLCDRKLYLENGMIQP